MVSPVLLMLYAVIVITGTLFPLWRQDAWWEPAAWRKVRADVVDTE